MAMRTVPTYRPPPLDIEAAARKQRLDASKPQDSSGESSPSTWGAHLSPPVCPPAPVHSHPPPLGESLPPSLVGGKYLVLDPSEGESLCRCVDVRTKEEYMCKVLPNDALGRSVLTAHVRLDAHPNINPLHEVLFATHHLYLVFPRSYGDLHSHLRTTRRLRDSQARELFRQILEAVAACHSNGIVLRDLKLKKFVFANPERTIVRLESLCDCVLVDDYDPDDEDGAGDDSLSERHGCPAYVSPEILTSGSTYSGRCATAWGLGVILYTMLLGRYPFYDADPCTVLAKIRRGRYSIPDCISSRARCLIKSLLRPDPTQRLSPADALRHPWLKGKLDYSPRRGHNEPKVWAARPGPRGPDQGVPES